MKLPRWLVFLLLGTSLTSVLGAAGWFWTIWPQRTIDGFVQLCREGGFEKAHQMLITPNWWKVHSGETLVLKATNGGIHHFPPMTWEPWFRNPKLQLKPLTAYDFLAGRRRFRLTACAYLEFTAAHGNVTLQWCDSEFKILRDAHEYNLTLPQPKKDKGG